jgi:hypothetical protein
MPWVLATAFGLGVPASLITWFFQSGAIGYSRSIFPVVGEVIILALGLGGFQAILLRRLIAKPQLWALAHLLGSLAVAVTLFGMMQGAFWLAEPIEKLFYAFDLWQLVEYREVLLLAVLASAFPFLYALIIGVPTGRILEKFARSQIAD